MMWANRNRILGADKNTQLCYFLGFLLNSYGPEGDIIIPCCTTYSRKLTRDTRFALLVLLYS